MEESSFLPAVSFYGLWSCDSTPCSRWTVSGSHGILCTFNRPDCVPWTTTTITQKVKLLKFRSFLKFKNLSHTEVATETRYLKLPIFFLALSYDSFQSSKSTTEEIKGVRWPSIEVILVWNVSPWDLLAFSTAMAYQTLTWTDYYKNSSIINYVSLGNAIQTLYVQFSKM